MSLAINVGYGLLGCIHQKYKYKTWKNTFKRLFWTDIFTVKSTKVFREGKVFQNVLVRVPESKLSGLPYPAEQAKQVSLNKQAKFDCQQNAYANEVKI